MNKTETEFLGELEAKARSERRLVETEILPAWARGLGEWLVVNPWRVLVPVSGLIYLALRLIVGTKWVWLMLALFGGFK